MNRLNTEPNIGDPDAFYEALIETHRDLSPAQSHALNARLILLLANHIGDLAVLREALAAAKAGEEAGEPHPHPSPPLEGEGTAQTNPHKRTVSEPSLPLQGGG